MEPVIPWMLMKRPPDSLMAIATTPKTSMNVPMISVIRFATVLRIAGPVQKTASFRPGSSVSLQCARYARYTMTAPIIAPMNSRAIVPRTWVVDQAFKKPPAHNPIVTAGLSCACPPRTARLQTIPMNTANPHAHVMTIHPEFCAFDLFRRTPATTPSPNTISVAVPTISPRYVIRKLPCADHPLLIVPRPGLIRSGDR